MGTQDGKSPISGNLIAGSSNDAIELDGNSAPILITVQSNDFLNSPSNTHNTCLKLLQALISALRLRNLFVGERIGCYEGGLPASRSTLTATCSLPFTIAVSIPHPMARSVTTESWTLIGPHDRNRHLAP